MLFRLDDIRSRLGRKFIVLLFLVALLPMMLFASFSYNYLANYLYSQSQKRLINEARFFTTTLYERLLLSSALFESLSAGDMREQDAEQIKRQFSFSEQVSWQRVRSLTEHMPVSERNQVIGRLEQRKLVLLTTADGGVFFLRMNYDSGEFPVRLAQVAPTYLLGDPELRDQRLHYCVFGSFNETLFCTPRHFISHHEFSRLLRLHDNSASFALEWDWNGQPELVQVRSIVLAQRFGMPAWKVWVSEPRQHVYEAIAELQSVFSLVVAVTLLLGAIVGAWQIKRFLTPLAHLIQGTRRIASGQFDVHVTVDSRDELEDLAQSFNHMASQLGKQFELLTGLSYIDQLILNVPDLEQVAQSTLGALQRLIDADAVAVALGDPDKPGEMAVFSFSQPSNQHALARRQLDESELQWLSQVPPIHRAALGDAQYLAWLWPQQRELLAGSSHLFPVIVNRQNLGLLAVAWQKSVRLPESDRLLLKDFADRLAVAITAVLREKKLYYQAHFDALTGLPNRQLLKDRLEQALRHALRRNGMGAVLFVDLDNFKQINDSGGHSLGDEILRRTAERLRVCVTDEDTVARQGGDEFIVVLNQIDSPLRATRVAEKIVTMLGSPYRIGERRYFLGASVGIAIFPNDGTDVDMLLRNADTALYRVKEEGRGHHRFFEEEMNQTSQRRITAERRIRDALEHGNILVHYQPQWYLNRDRFSLEALVRIKDPEVGLLAPLEFIGVAEDTGLILDIGEWVLRQACQQMASWRMADVPLERLAVNVSGRQLARTDFVRMVESAVEDFKLDFTDLELEITETTLIQDAESAVQKLGVLNEMGVRIAIDDFGTGYSSLSYLHRLPFDVLKIDSSFIANMHEHRRSLEITSTIISLARSLHKIVMAEGVETRAQLDLLRQLKCDAIQGFYISRPLSAAKVEDFITQFRPVNLPAL